MAVANARLPGMIPTAPAAIVNARSTAPSSRTVVPAMSRQASSIRAMVGFLS